MAKNTWCLLKLWACGASQRPSLTSLRYPGEEGLTSNPPPGAVQNLIEVDGPPRGDLIEVLGARTNVLTRPRSSLRITYDRKTSMRLELVNHQRSHPRCGT